MNLLIVGGSGFLGRELAQRALATGHTVTATYATRAGDLPGIHWLPLDLRRSEEITPALRETRPDVVINTAYRKADWATTADGAICLAVAAARHGSRMVHVSSDAVFSGADVRYDESAAPDPVTPYGAAKAAAETAIRRFAPAAVIARTSLIVGDGGSVHEAFIHDLATGRRNGVLFTDVIRCPVHVADLARALLELTVFGDRAAPLAAHQIDHLLGARGNHVRVVLGAPATGVVDVERTLRGATRRGGGPPDRAGPAIGSAHLFRRALTEGRAGERRLGTSRSPALAPPGRGRGSREPMTRSRFPGKKPAPRRA